MDKLPKLTSLPFTEFIGKKRSDLKDYLEKEYKDRLPGQEALDYLLNNPKEVPESLKDGNWHYFFALSFRSSGGGAGVPTVYWHGERLYRGGRWLGREWDDYDRVVLLDSADLTLNPSIAELNLALCTCKISDEERDAITLLKERGYKITKEF